MKANGKAECAICATAPAPEQKMRRVMVVDDHPLTREGLAHLLNTRPDLKICCEAGDPAVALAHLEHSRPDLLVTDLTLPGRGGLELIKDLRQKYPDLPVLVISMHDELVHAERAFRNGAVGYVMKEAGAEIILQAIETTLGGKRFASERLRRHLLENFADKKQTMPSPVQTLTDREYEVFELIGRGHTSKEIGVALNLSPKTVAVHRSNIKLKLNIPDSTALMRFAICWTESITAQN